MTAIVPASAENVKHAALILRNGGLVSFPTETVYGLGAHGLQEKAILSIFSAKGRPLTDPLILHVPSLEAALPLASLSSDAASLVHALASRFWPGPLTIVVPASAEVPSCVRAGGPSVALRVPGHPVALALLREAGVPIAAPSANRFGHVSPTRAAHVAADLQVPGLLILDGGACPVGIESTIVRCHAGRVEILRRGYVTLREVRDALEGLVDASAVTALTRHVSSSSDDQSQDAPGQLLTHYAPDVPAFLVSPGESTRAALGSLSETVVIDVGGRLAALEADAMGYRDLAAASSGDEAGHARDALRYAFDALRWAEAVPGARRILLPDLAALSDERLLALADRLFRSASGRRVEQRGHSKEASANPAMPD